MDSFVIENGFQSLGLELPPAVVRVRRAVDKLGEIAITPRRQRTPEELAVFVVAQAIAEGAVPDVLQLAREDREAADAGTAYAVVESAIEQANRRLEGALLASAPALLAAVRVAIEQLLEEARQLPPDTPSTADEAVHSDEARQTAYRQLEQLAARHAQLRRLHREIVGNDVEPPAAFALFAETQHAPSRAQGGRLKAAGPEGLRRVLWLAGPEGEAWVPAASDISARYLAWVRESQQLPAVVRRS